MRALGKEGNRRRGIGFDLVENIPWIFLCCPLIVFIIRKRENSVCGCDDRVVVTEIPVAVFVHSFPTPQDHHQDHQKKKKGTNMMEVVVEEEEEVVKASESKGVS